MNIDFILPFYSPAHTQGSYVHFRSLALTLQARGHDVCVRTGTSGHFVIGPRKVKWIHDRKPGKDWVEDVPVHYYPHRPIWHPERIRRWFGSRVTFVNDAWRMADIPRPWDAWRVQQLTPEEAEARVRVLIEEAQHMGPSRAYYSSFALGPPLPVKDMMADAHERRATVIAGYFPFQTVSDAVRAGQPWGVPVWVCPLFHALDVTHHNTALYEALRQARGVLTLSPFNERIIRDGIGAPSVTFIGSAPPRCDEAYEKTDTTPPYAVVFGRFHAGKNVPEAIRIVDAFRRRTGIPMELTCMAGEGKGNRDALPPYATVLSNLTTKEAHRVLSQATALLFPSLHESFGIVCFEAYTHGTPALARRSNLATASVFRQFGLDSFLYEDEKEAVEMLEKIYAKQLAVPPDYPKDQFCWEAVTDRVEHALGAAVR